MTILAQEKETRNSASVKLKVEKFMFLIYIIRTPQYM